MSEIIRLNAGNDRNGNPRRVFVEIAKGQITGAWDEGYEGSHPIPTPKRSKWGGLTLMTTPAQYRDILGMKLPTFPA